MILNLDENTVVAQSHRTILVVAQTPQTPLTNDGRIVLWL